MFRIQISSCMYTQHEDSSVTLLIHLLSATRASLDNWVQLNNGEHKLQHFLVQLHRHTACKY